MKGYLTDPYFSLTQMLNFSWQAWEHILGYDKMDIISIQYPMFSQHKIEIFIVVGDQCWYHVKYDHPASCYPDGLSLQKVGYFDITRILQGYFNITRTSFHPILIMKVNPKRKEFKSL